MISVIEGLKKHLEMSHQLYYEAKQILKCKLGIYDTEKAVKNVAKEKNLKEWKLKVEVRVLKEKQKYIATKNAIDEAYTNNADEEMIREIAKKYNVSREILRNETEEHKKMKLSYNYDPVIKIRKVFTFAQERTIMKMLRVWKTENKCKCQLCALIHLSEMACKFAKENVTDGCPKKWKKTADVKWLYCYEIRHMKSFRKHFDSFKECKIFPYQASSSFMEQHTLNISSVSTQEDQSSNVTIILC